MLLLPFRPFSSIYPFNERDDVCLNFYYLCPFFFFEEMGRCRELARVEPAPLVSPLNVFKWLISILLHGLLA